MNEPTLAAIEILLREAGAIAKAAYKNPMTTTAKSHPDDIVTETDKHINQHLIHHIKEKYPDHGIISEEDEEVKGSAEWTWICDPIDGTKNFATQVPIYGVMIAVARSNEVLLAGIYLPETDELMLAQKGKGCFLNGKQVHCSPQKKLSETRGLGYSYYKPHKAQRIAALVKYEGRFQMSAFGCAAADGVYVASGRRDWYISDGASIWDYAAVTLCLMEAGCIITTHDGKPWQLTDTNLVAANPALHAHIIAALGEKK